MTVKEWTNYFVTEKVEFLKTTGKNLKEIISLYETDIEQSQHLLYAVIQNKNISNKQRADKIKGLCIRINAITDALILLQQR